MLPRLCPPPPPPPQPPSWGWVMGSRVSTESHPHRSTRTRELQCAVVASPLYLRQKAHEGNTVVWFAIPLCWKTCNNFSIMSRFRIGVLVIPRKLFHFQLYAMSNPRSTIHYFGFLGCTIGHGETTTTTTTTSLFLTLNIQVSHHLQIARLIEAGGVRTA